MASTRTPGHLMTVRVMLFNLHGDEDKKGANGVDALKVYRQDEDHVIKLRRMNADSYWHVDAFNELFGDRTPYEILGAGECHGRGARPARPPSPAHQV